MAKRKTDKQWSREKGQTMVKRKRTNNGQEKKENNGQEKKDKQW